MAYISPEDVKHISRVALKEEFGKTYKFGASNETFCSGVRITFKEGPAFSYPHLIPKGMKKLKWIPNLSQINSLHICMEANP